MKKFLRYLTFLFILFCVGFVLGTVTLSLMVENLLTYMHKYNWLTEYENIIVISIIIIYLIYSLLIAVWFNSIYIKLSRRGGIFFLLLLAILTGVCIWSWLTPEKIDENTAYITSSNGRFVAGPYPDKRKMIGLKNSGYTAIISLLSSYVVPFEPILLEKEIKTAEEVGIPIIHLPLLPWITENKDSLDKIAALARDSAGKKYYVHCYYGRDRVSMFMRIVDPHAGVRAIKPHENNPDSKPKLKALTLERGKALTIDDHVIFGPLPTDDEFTAYIVNLKEPVFKNNPIRYVYSIQTASGSILPAELSLKNFGVEFNTFIIEDYPYQTEKIFDFANKIKNAEEPVLVYEFYLDPQPRPIVLEGVMLAYLTNLPSIPKRVFADKQMKNGKPESLAPNIVAGPQPSDEEYANFIYYLGIRSLVYIGDCNSHVVATEKKKALAAHLNFICVKSDAPELISILAKDGPWYVYGPESEKVEDKLEAYFAHSFPDLTPPPEKKND